MSRYVVVAILVVMAVAAFSQPATEGSNPPKCAVNQTYSLCGEICEPSCQDPTPDLICPRILCTRFTGGCRCDEGYVRSNSRDCILLKDCPRVI